MSNDDNKKVVITDDQYKKLNWYYNELCLGLLLNDSFLLNNLNLLGNLSVAVLNLLDNFNLEITSIDENFTFMEVYDKAKEVIKEIKPEYLEDYNKLIDSGILDFNYERLDIPLEERSKFGQSVFYPYYKADEDNTRIPEMDNIYIDETFNYDAVAVLVHEYFHRTNESNSTARYLLTEYISSYFEIYTYEYLKKQGVDPSRLNLAFRLYDLKKCADFLDFESFYMYTYETLGGFNDNNFEYINYSKLSENQHKENLLSILERFERCEEEYNKQDEREKEPSKFKYYLASKCNSHYRYFIGALLAYYSLYNLDKEDVLRLNEEFRKVDSMNFSEALDILGVELNDELISKSLDAVEKYAQENNLLKDKEANKKM